MSCDGVIRGYRRMERARGDPRALGVVLAVSAGLRLAVVGIPARLHARLDDDGAGLGVVLATVAPRLYLGLHLHAAPPLRGRRDAGFWNSLPCRRQAQTPRDSGE